MKYRILAICVLLSAFAAAQTKPKTTTPTKTASSKPVSKSSPANTAPVLKSALDSFSYALGMSVGNFCNQQKIANVNTAVLMRGLNDAAKAGKPVLTEQQMNSIISGYLNREKAEKAKVAKAQGEKFMADNAKKAGVVTLASGLQYQVLRAGSDTAAKPTLADQVKCHYTGMTIDGNVFETSLTNGQPITFGLTGVIAGWTEALQLMTPGAKWRLFIPSDLAYGDNAGPGAPFPPGSTLIFDVELLEVIKGAGGGQ